ncbi:MAG: magnesium chelatase domain-containing protein, partial [Coriobacteriia bacterium]|nr:magnesium chelatase domain-containing protein [Coriobacteriia bacterium]
RVTEPAIDLPLALALASSRSDRPLSSDCVAFGELGLTGDVRSVPHIAARVREARRMGFTQAFGPAGSESAPVTGVSAVRTLAGALESVLGT